MQLAIDTDKQTNEQILALADEDLINDVVEIIDLDKSLNQELKQAIIETYSEFLFGHFDLKNYYPEHKKVELLKTVKKAAEELHCSLSELVDCSEADLRLANSLRELDTEHVQSERNLGIWNKIIEQEGWNPNLFLRHLIADIIAATENASNEEWKECDDPILNSFHPEARKEHNEKRSQRIKLEKIQKDLPIRNSIQILKSFFDKHVEYPFTAGKYYPEIGFKSPAFHAVTIVLKKIYPSVSDRKIASIMQEFSCK